MKELKTFVILTYNHGEIEIQAEGFYVDADGVVTFFVPGAEEYNQETISAWASGTWISVNVKTEAE